MAPLSIYLSQVPVVHIHSVMITRPVKLAVPSLFFPGSIWNLSFINKYIFKGEEKYISIYVIWQKKTVKNGYYWRQFKTIDVNYYFDEESKTMCYEHLLINIILPVSICFLVYEKLVWFLSLGDICQIRGGEAAGRAGHRPGLPWVYLWSGDWNWNWDHCDFAQGRCRLQASFISDIREKAVIAQFKSWELSV